MHLIGLTETKEGGKKLIERNKPEERHTGTLLENAIIQLDSLDKISRLEKPSQYGANLQERLFNVGLELVITWINRILFLKLLEAQLLSYHKGDKSYEFLSPEKIKDYDDLNSLFFQVLARRQEDRNEDVNIPFAKVPYLNSSLFEPTEIEHTALFISQLSDFKTIPIYQQTVIKDEQGKKRTGEMNSLEYLFLFLNAYDFTSEGGVDIQDDNKTLINASVLGLIFEKINGYKDGSFFTPGFITMYMCRETIRKSVVQKFNEAKNWNCTNIDEIYDKIEDRAEANRIVNDIKICDPAVGSGHFLVSALNEIIAIKSDLKILQDRSGKRLKEYHVEVVNDELITTDEDGELFEYHPTNKESQRIQETLFHEKQTIIENCLFGVDINPNSVKICRLRLWIELLKNAYYKKEAELETLPNIDINIKCGNSLISRFALDADLKQALRKSASKWSIESYRSAVDTYRNAESKEQKREMERLINEIKSNFRSEISMNDPMLKRYKKLSSELLFYTNQGQLFEMSPEEKAEWEKKVIVLTQETKKLDAEIEEIKSNKIYENAFEWRFEFPEVLDDNGEFLGFDVVIGNPPYIRQEEFKEHKLYLKANYTVFTGTSDLYAYFVEKGFGILKAKGHFNYIMPNKWMQAGYGKPLRVLLLQNQLHSLVDFGDLQVFDEATTYPCLVLSSKDKPRETFESVAVKSLKFSNEFELYVESIKAMMNTSDVGEATWVISSVEDKMLLSKIQEKSISLSEYVGGKSFRGVLTGLTEAFLINDETKERLILEDERSKDLIKPFLQGRNIRPYTTSKSSNWLILIPKGFTIKRNLPVDDVNYVSEAMPRYGNMHVNNAWDWFCKNYPAIAKHLLPFKKKAEARTDQGDFWWELRACDYYSEFEKPKIMYQKFQVKPCFIYDNSGVFCNDSMWIIPRKDVFLIGVLNSKIGWWLISKYCTAIQNGYQLIWQYFGQIPISTNESYKNEIIGLVNDVILSKENERDTTTLESEINRLVYQLYDLTEDEIELIENSVK